ncbi:MAG: hypothetical protein JWR10_2835 [Rubritepida sp.]|nr:hypothetical protein [Rubritepida sp.]
MSYNHQPLILPPEAIRPAATDPDSVTLRLLVQRTCQALHAMATSLEALDSVFTRIEALTPETDAHAELLATTQETVVHVVGLLRREGPPLLFRAQALRLRLRLHGYASGSSAAVAMRALHTDLDGFVAFEPEQPASWLSSWGACIRRARSNTMILLSEFDGQRRQMTAPSEAPDALVHEVLAPVAALPMAR